ILGDPNQLHQILINLVTNAAQAIGDAIGKITIGLAPDAPRPGALGAATASLRLSLCDTGAGMDPATMERIFEPFFPTTAVGEGTGLGLAVVYGIVTDPAATVEASSEPRRGTQFDRLLPRAAGAQRDDADC